MLRKIALMAVLAAVVLTTCGCQPEQGTLVEETYTVKTGDTLWNICEEYTAKNCKTTYVLETKYEIEAMNPWLKDSRGIIYPGEKIKIAYYVREE